VCGTSISSSSCCCKNQTPNKKNNHYHRTSDPPKKQKQLNPQNPSTKCIAIEANSSHADQNHNPCTKPHHSPPTQPSHQNDNQIDTIRQNSKRKKIREANKRKRETISEIEKARVNEGAREEVAE